MRLTALARDPRVKRALRAPPQTRWPLSLRQGIFSPRRWGTDRPTPEPPTMTPPPPTATPPTTAPSPATSPLTPTIPASSPPPAQAAGLPPWEPPTSEAEAEAGVATLDGAEPPGGDAKPAATEPVTAAHGDDTHRDAHRDDADGADTHDDAPTPTPTPPATTTTPTTTPTPTPPKGKFWTSLLLLTVGLANGWALPFLWVSPPVFSWTLVVAGLIPVASAAFSLGYYLRPASLLKLSDLFRSDPKSWAAVPLILSLVALGALGLALNAPTAESMGALIVLAGASFGFGFLVGLLFGHPRSTTRTDAPGTRVLFQQNTSLERICDAATTAIITVGAVEFQSIVSFVWGVGLHFERLGVDPAVCCGAIVLFIITGFFHGYFQASLRLPDSLVDAAQRSQTGTNQNVHSTVPGDPAKPATDPLAPPPEAPSGK